MMGFAPSQIDQMSVWEFECCIAPHLKNSKNGNDNELLDDDAFWREQGIEGF